MSITSINEAIAVEEKYKAISHKEEIEKITTADHSQFEVLKQDFKDPREVTAACLTCHTEAAEQIHKTIHWTWVCPKSNDGTIGKSTVINNFCMALPSNEPRCTSCHTGYGWNDKTFDFTKEENVDCLVCHDKTGDYVKFPSGAGLPADTVKIFKGNNKTYFPPDYSFVAQNVGKPGRDNCGTCHYFGGGGNKVKHGDLDVIMNSCTEDIDVHMAMNGLNFSCQTCHSTENHRISGRCYEAPAMSKDDRTIIPNEMKQITCESCHSSTPHKFKKINDHADKVACQTCHIPTMAKGNPTKMWWDWSKAGKKNAEGKPFQIKDSLGNVIYDTKKGEFQWATNIEPEYFWHNGSIKPTVVSDVIDPTKIVKMNHLSGDYNDPTAKIYPFKVHRGKQPYDKKNNTFVVPKLFGKKGSGAFWGEFDWNKSITVGMEYTGAPYSGEYDFVETEMYWLVAHMVAPADQALTCRECHDRNDSRLKNLDGFYMPGRDKLMVDNLGLIGLVLVFGGVIIHGSIRLITRKQREQKHKKEEENNNEESN